MKLQFKLGRITDPIPVKKKSNYLDKLDKKHSNPLYKIYWKVRTWWFGLIGE